MSEKTVLPDLDEDERKLSQAIQEIEAEGDDHLIRLSTGVVLEAKQANPNQIIKVLSRFPAPEPPMYFNKDMGRWIENTADPDYALKMQAWKMQYANATNNVFISYGTKIHSKPKGMPGPEDDEWLQQLYALDQPVMADNKYWRYLNWVLTVAAPLDTDTQLIQRKVGRLSGVQEVDAQAASTFPGRDQKR